METPGHTSKMKTTPQLLPCFSFLLITHHLDAIDFTYDLACCLSPPTSPTRAGISVSGPDAAFQHQEQHLAGTTGE